MARSRGKKNQRFKKKKQSTEPPFRETCCGIPFNNRVSYMQHVRDRHPWMLVKGL